MSTKRYKPEQVVNLLRQIEVETANGKTTPQACRDAQITVQTYYRWRKEFGGLKLDQAKRLKELEKENSRLKRLVAELSPGEAGFAGCGAGKLVSRNFHFELPLHPKTYASYPVVSTANSSGLFEVVVRHILAVLRSRCAGFACPACLAADTYPARPLLSTYNYPLSWVASPLAAAVPRSFAACC